MTPFDAPARGQHRHHTCAHCTDRRRATALPGGEVQRASAIREEDQLSLPTPVCDSRARMQLDYHLYLHRDLPRDDANLHQQTGAKSERALQPLTERYRPSHGDHITARGGTPDAAANWCQRPSGRAGRSPSRRPASNARRHRASASGAELNGADAQGVWDGAQRGGRARGGGGGRGVFEGARRAHLGHQVGAAVDHLGLLRVVIDTVHEAHHLDNLLDLCRIARHAVDSARERNARRARARAQATHPPDRGPS